MNNAVFVMVGCIASAVSVAYAAGPVPATPSSLVANGGSMDAVVHADLLDRQKKEAAAMIVRHAKEREAASLAAALVAEEGGPQQASRLKSQHLAR